MNYPALALYIYKELATSIKFQRTITAREAEGDSPIAGERSELSVWQPSLTCLPNLLLNRPYLISDAQMDDLDRIAISAHQMPRFLLGDDLNRFQAASARIVISIPHADQLRTILSCQSFRPRCSRGRGAIIIDAS
jgi:hypothetical protein